MAVNIRKAQDFQLKIEELAKANDIGLIDAILLYCEREGLETETVPSLLTPNLKQRLEIEAQKFRLLKQTGGAPSLFGEDEDLPEGF